MGVRAVHDYDPYTVYDLEALPEDGKYVLDAEIGPGQALTSQPIAVS